MDFLGYTGQSFPGNIIEPMRSFAELARVAQPDHSGASRLQGRAIYILPTQYGLMFGGLLLLLLIGSINYANSPAYLLTFLLGGLFVQAMYSTWRNLKGIAIRFVGAEPVFTGEEASLSLRLEPELGDKRWAIQLSLAGGSTSVLDLAEGGSATALHLPTRKRGWAEAGRITLESRYPLGLFRAWGYAQTGARVLVFPRPLSGREPLGSPEQQGSLLGDKGRGTDDFAGHRSYQAGDPPKHLNWKLFAAERGLYTKEFGGDRVELVWLDFSELLEANTEIRLGILTGLVVQADDAGLNYGLRLPGVEIAPARGSAHRLDCLTALALFGVH